jgi:hypothetical protein
VYPVAPDNALTVSPVTGSVFQGVVTVPPELLADGRRAYLVCDLEGRHDSKDTSETAAAVRVNDAYAGGFIGKPFRVAITKHLQDGYNRIRIEPFPVEQVRIEFF